MGKSLLILLQVRHWLNPLFLQIEQLMQQCAHNWGAILPVGTGGFYEIVRWLEWHLMPLGERSWEALSWERGTILLFDRFHSNRTFPSICLFNFIFYFLILPQGPSAKGNDFCSVNINIFTSIIGRNESKSLLVIIPFDGASGHCSSQFL